MATAPAIDGAAALDEFRSEARAWLTANFPVSLKGKDNALSALEGPHDPTEDEIAWTRAMGEKGWGVPTWPAAYGGGGSIGIRRACCKRKWAGSARGTRLAAWA